ncbi:uncharacterized protein [Palaemon carinicauda]|uniref:uncharacterized protein n=1 Tax=Palaemon carinicauda TaxID=392227 RepID=UPI0035B6369C
MPRLLSKLRFWSNKSCQACKGHPTPPPCYNCVLKLETPPPDFTSLHEHGHFFSEDDQSSLYPFAEEYTYPEDAQMGLEEEFKGGNEELCQGRASPFGNFHREIDDTSDFREYELPRPLSNVPLAFLPDDQRQQHQDLLSVHTPKRMRHPSAPVLSSNGPHLGVARTASTSRLAYLDTSTYEDDRETITSSSRSLLAALNAPIMQMEDQLLIPEPLSPRNRSPLPSQLLIPE